MDILHKHIALLSKSCQDSIAQISSGPKSQQEFDRMGQQMQKLKDLVRLQGEINAILGTAIPSEPPFVAASSPLPVASSSPSPPAATTPSPSAPSPSFSSPAAQAPPSYSQQQPHISIGRSASAAVSAPSLPSAAIKALPPRDLSVLQSLPGASKKVSPPAGPQSSAPVPKPFRPTVDLPFVAHSANSIAQEFRSSPFAPSADGLPPTPLSPPRHSYNHTHHTRVPSGGHVNAVPLQFTRPPPLAPPVVAIPAISNLARPGSPPRSASPIKSASSPPQSPSKLSVRVQSEQPVKDVSLSSSSSITVSSAPNSATSTPSPNAPKSFDETPANRICIFYWNNFECKKGDQCKYEHCYAPLPWQKAASGLLCPAYSINKQCEDHKNCKFAHIFSKEVVWPGAHPERPVLCVQYLKKQTCGNPNCEYVHWNRPSPKDLREQKEKEKEEKKASRENSPPSASSTPLSAPSASAAASASSPPAPVVVDSPSSAAKAVLIAEADAAIHNLVNDMVNKTLESCSQIPESPNDALSASSSPSDSVSANLSL